MIPTKKEAPADAEALSHKMMVRAGYIYQVSAGVWAYLPMAYRVIRKVENIIREEMDKAGAVEMMLICGRSRAATKAMATTCLSSRTAAIVNLSWDQRMKKRLPVFCVTACSHIRSCHW